MGLGLHCLRGAALRMEMAVCVGNLVSVNQALLMKKCDGSEGQRWQR